MDAPRVLSERRWAPASPKSPAAEVPPISLYEAILDTDVMHLRYTVDMISRTLAALQVTVSSVAEKAFGELAHEQLSVSVDSLLVHLLERSNDHAVGGEGTSGSGVYPQAVSWQAKAAGLPVSVLRADAPSFQYRPVSHAASESEPIGAEWELNVCISKKPGAILKENVCSQKVMSLESKENDRVVPEPLPASPRPMDSFGQAKVCQTEDGGHQEGHGREHNSVPGASGGSSVALLWEDRACALLDAEPGLGYRGLHARLQKEQFIVSLKKVHKFVTSRRSVVDREKGRSSVQFICERKTC